MARYGGTCHFTNDLNPPKDLIISSVREGNWENSPGNPLYLMLEAVSKEEGTQWGLGPWSEGSNPCSATYSQCDIRQVA